MNKLVSIIIPCYNSAKYIRETILSVLNQSYQNIEIICVDNDSTDDTLTILEELAKKNNQIRLYKQPKKGAPAARNLGIENAHGDVIQFLDSDDLIMPEKLNDQIHFMNKGDFDIVVSDRTVYNSNMSEILAEIKFPEVQSDPLLVALREIIITGNPIYKKSLFKKFGGWDENLESAQDWELNIRMTLMGALFGYLEGSYLKCRAHNESLSSNWIKVSRSGIKVLQKWQNEILKSAAIQNSEVQKKIFFCYFDVAIYDNASNTFKTKMKEWKIPILQQLPLISKLIALIFGISNLIKLKNLLQRKKKTAL